MKREPFPFDRELGVILRRIRRAEDISQRELGAKMGVHNTAISDHERGTCHTTVEYLLKFSEAMGIHPVDVLNLHLRRQADGL